MNLKGKRRTLFLLLAVVILVGGFWLWQVLNAPVPQYRTLIVRPGELQQNVLATGKLDALRKVDVGAQVSGQLKTLSVEIGDKVKKASCWALSILNRPRTRSARWKPR
jgi:macrolide-specific efflux system membrane fusion protein